ncbi:MAG TPA: hypothetical protein VI457_02490 [Methylococcaceae bacterium]|nr:hypothetical protein [Methylococcaceae bacterium]
MRPSRLTPSPAAPWHALLVPLPPDAVLRRQPVAPPEIRDTPQGAAIAGWEQVTAELSAGAAGLRHVLVVLDGAGQPISACDTVLYRREIPREAGEPGASSAVECEIEFYQESLGGRLEPDGSFRGTRWRTVGLETMDDGEPRMESTPSEPSADDVAGLKALVADVLRRQATTKPA